MEQEQTGRIVIIVPTFRREDGTEGGGYGHIDIGRPYRVFFHFTGILPTDGKTSRQIFESLTGNENVMFQILTERVNASGKKQTQAHGITILN